MSSTVAAVWETLIGLVIEDGQLAVGIVGALAVVWIAATVSAAILELSGWLLLALLVVVLAANLALTARRVKRRAG